MGLSDRSRPALVTRITRIHRFWRKLERSDRAGARPRLPAQRSDVGTRGTRAARRRRSDHRALSARIRRDRGAARRRIDGRLRRQRRSCDGCREDRPRSDRRPVDGWLCRLRAVAPPPRPRRASLSRRHPRRGRHRGGARQAPSSRGAHPRARDRGAAEDAAAVAAQGFAALGSAAEDDPRPDARRRGAGKHRDGRPPRQPAGPTDHRRPDRVRGRPARMASTDSVIVRATDVARVYPTGATAVSALDGVTLEVRRGEFLAVMGPSGSGKSTLLNILGGLERPTRGAVVVDGVDLSAMNEVTLASYRREKVGMIFQAFNLLPRYRVVENVALPLVFAGIPLERRLERARSVLDRLGMGPRADHRPSQLSGGEMQRTAIARALVTEPPLLLADEPTGNLDSANGEALLGVLEELHARGQTVVLVTHDAGIASHAQRVVRMRDGRIVN